MSILKHNSYNISAFLHLLLDYLHNDIYYILHKETRLKMSILINCPVRLS